MRGIPSIFIFFKIMKHRYPDVNMHGMMQWSDDRTGNIEVEFTHDRMNHNPWVKVNSTGDRAIEQALRILERKIDRYFWEYQKREADRQRFLALPPEEREKEINEQVARAMKFLEKLDLITSKEDEAVDSNTDENNLEKDSDSAFNDALDVINFNNDNKELY